MPQESSVRMMIITTPEVGSGEAEIMRELSGFQVNKVPGLIEDSFGLAVLTNH